MQWDGISAAPRVITCSVESTELGAYPRWFGLPVSFERSLCQSLHRVATSKDVDPDQRSRVSKFQPCIPPDIEHGLIARETMNVDDSDATLVEWKQRAQHGGEDA